MSIGSPAFAVIGGMVVLGTPFFFQKIYKSLFTRKLVLEFDNQSVVIKEFKLKDDSLVDERRIHWNDLSEYSFNVSQSGVTYLKIYFRGGERKGFAFSEEKNEQRVLNEKSALSIFYYYIFQYNIGRRPEQTIQFRPGYLTTNSGKRLLFSLLFVSIFLIIFHIIISPRTSMFSAMSFFILLGLVAKRRSDSMLYKKMLELKPQSPF